MTTTAQRPQPGPPLAVLGIVYTGLFLVGLILGSLIAARVYPSPYAPENEILSYFAGNSLALSVTSFFFFGASIPLAIYTATATSRLRYMGFRVPGVQIAMAGGLLASAFLALTGLLAWVLGRP